MAKTAHLTCRLLPIDLVRESLERCEALVAIAENEVTKTTVRGVRPI